MEDGTNMLDKRKDKMIKWIKNPYNFALVVIADKTKQQPALIIYELK